LFNQVYDSPPVKFTLRRDQYRQGTNDQIYINDRNIGRRELVELIRFIGSDNPSTILGLRGGGEVNFLPSTQYVLTINRDELLEKGIITQEQYPFTVPEMQYDISADRGSIHRADLAFLDIFASNNWERPIHVINPYAQRNVWPIAQFAQLEGVLHHFVPYYNPNRNLTASGLNGIATEKTYNLFMNEFTWGNLNHDRTRVSLDSRRSAEEHRIQFVYLAQALIADRKMDSAILVLDRALELFPHHKVGFDSHRTGNIGFIYYVQAYIQAGHIEKGLALAAQLVDIYENNLRYFERFPAKHRRFLEPYIQDSISMFGFLRNQFLTGAEEEGKELFERLDNLLASRGVQM
jgi:tetratricopeptide (TPR) repeat protein